MTSQNAESESGKCPLGPGLHWENDLGIPDFCLEHCGSFIESAGMVGGPEEEDSYDYFPLYSEMGRVCSHNEIETEDRSLQRGIGAQRTYSVTDECLSCGEEYGAQSYGFTCRFE